MQNPRPIEAAATRLLRQRTVTDRQLMEQLSRPAARLQKDPERDPGSLQAVLEAIAAHLPGNMRLQPDRAGDGMIVAELIFDGEEERRLSFAIISAHLDGQQRPWTAVAGVYAIGIGEPDDDDEEEEDRLFERRELLNRLNDRTPGGTWQAEDGNLAFITGCAFPGDRADDPNLLRRLVEHLLDATAYGSRIVPADGSGPHPAWLREKENEQFQRIIGNRFAGTELEEAADGWRRSLPQMLAASVEIRRAEPWEEQEGVTLLVDVPAPGPDGADHLRLVLDLSETDEAGGGLPQGIHIYCRLPGRMSREEAGTWCERLNGGDQSSDDEAAVTTSWWYGNWYHDRDDSQRGHTIIHYGVIPHKFRGLCDLQQEIDGVVREICAGQERVHFARQHQQLVDTQDRGDG